MHALCDEIEIAQISEGFKRNVYENFQGGPRFYTGFYFTSRDKRFRQNSYEEIWNLSKIPSFILSFELANHALAQLMGTNEQEGRLRQLNPCLFQNLSKTMRRKSVGTTEL